MPHLETTTRELFTFDELSDDAKQVAIDNNRDFNADYEWWDSVYENATTIADLMGIEIDRIYFSGFCSQGDGACFESSYRYKAGSVKAVKEYAGEDKKLHAIAQALQDAQKVNFYQLYGSTKQRGHYQHSGCMAVDVNRDSDTYQDMTEDAEDAITDALRSFANWIYTRLESEHEHLTSDDVIAESLAANDMEFLEDGESA